MCFAKRFPEIFPRVSLRRVTPYMNRARPPIILNAIVSSAIMFNECRCRHMIHMNFMPFRNSSLKKWSSGFTVPELVFLQPSMSSKTRTCVRFDSFFLEFIQNDVHTNWIRAIMSCNNNIETFLFTCLLHIFTHMHRNNSANSCMGKFRYWFGSCRCSACKEYKLLSNTSTRTSNNFYKWVLDFFFFDYKLLINILTFEA